MNQRGASSFVRSRPDGIIVARVSGRRQVTVVTRRLVTIGYLRAGENLIDFSLFIPKLTTGNTEVHREFQRSASSSSLSKNSGYEIAAASAPWIRVSSSAFRAATAKAIAMR